MPRDEFTKHVKDSLRMRAALICSNPECRKMTAAAAMSSPDSFVCLGKAAHIAAAAAGGPRFDASMSDVQRSGIENAIYLCSSCADLIDKNRGTDFPTSLLIEWKRRHEEWVSDNLNRGQSGKGGDGGSATIVGDRGIVIGGRGGDGGTSGIGGRGGGGHIVGDDATVIGGDGGNATTADGRGGAGARGPTERFGIPTSLWGFGRGGSAANHPEFDRRIALIAQFRNEYRVKFPVDAPCIDAGLDVVPVDWINQRLSECNETWRVSLGETGYQLPPVT